MPFGSILAVPYDPKEDEINPNNQILYQSIEETNLIESLEQSDSFLNKQTIIRFKCVQLILSIIALILFMCEKSIMESVTKDLLISGFFGASIMYPLMVLNLPEYNKLLRLLSVLNFLSALMLITNGFLIFTSWHELQNILLANEISQDDPKNTAALLKFWSAILSILCGTLYGIDVFIQFLDSVRALF